jgi:uncharacterized protein YjcR
MSKDQRGEHNNRAKLTWDDVREIRKRWASDPSLTQQALSEEYGVSAATIHNVVTRKSWKNDSEDKPVIKFL